MKKTELKYGLKNYNLYAKFLLKKYGKKDADERETESILDTQKKVTHALHRNHVKK